MDKINKMTVHKGKCPKCGIVHIMHGIQTNDFKFQHIPKTITKTCEIDKSVVTLELTEIINGLIPIILNSIK